MVEVQQPGAVGEGRGGLPAERDGDVLGTDRVLLQHATDRVGPQQPQADGVVVEAADAFEGVAQRQVADVVQQRGDPQEFVPRTEVRDQREDTEGVLQPGVRLQGADRRGPACATKCRRRSGSVRSRSTSTGVRRTGTRQSGSVNSAARPTTLVGTGRALSAPAPCDAL